MAKPARASKAQRKPVPIDQPPGMSGLRRTDWRGWVDEEFLRDLRGNRAIKVYREMADDDIVAACIGTIKSTLRNVKWSAQGGDDERKEFVEQCFADFSWPDALSEALSMLEYGWAWLVPGYKRRGGMTDDSMTTSKYKDGKIGWSGWYVRSQDSWSEWQWHPVTGQLTAMVQQPPPRYDVIPIPLSQSLHFRTVSHKDNPEGKSLLRAAFRPWKFKRNLETIEAIGMERDLAGLPVIKRNPTYKGDDDYFKDLLRKVRRDENEGLIIPLIYDENGKEMVTFELLSSGGSRQFDSHQVIERKNRQIALAIHTDFILLGHEAVGSFALSDSKTSIYALVCGAILDSIERVINEYAVTRLLAINGMSTEDAPQWKHGDVETPDLKIQGDFLRAYTDAGGEAFPDPDLDEYFRKIANWPLKSEETMTLQLQAKEEALALAQESMRSAGNANEEEKVEDDAE